MERCTAEMLVELKRGGEQCLVVAYAEGNHDSEQRGYEVERRDKGAKKSSEGERTLPGSWVPYKKGDVCVRRVSEMMIFFGDVGYFRLIKNILRDTYNNACFKNRYLILQQA